MGNLTREDGRVLMVCATKKDRVGAKDSSRFIRTAATGEPQSYVGNLYPGKGKGGADLNGAEFQDNATRIRYRLVRSHTTQSLYSVVIASRGRK